MSHERQRGCFVVCNPLNGKRKRIKDEGLARKTAIALRRWVDLQRRRIPAYRRRQWMRRAKKSDPRRFIRAYMRKRKAAVLRARPAWADRMAIRAIYARARQLTIETGKLYSVDHVIPIQGRIVCGLHVETNLSIIEHRENSRKCNRFVGG